MKETKIVPFGTTQIEGKQCLNYVYVAFVADTVLSECKVPTVLMKNRINCSVEFIGGIVQNTNDLISDLATHVYNQTGLVFGFEKDRVLPVCSHSVFDSAANGSDVVLINHLYYVKIKESSIAKIMIGLIDCGINISNFGSILVPIANFKEPGKSNLEEVINNLFKNSTDSVSDGFLLLAGILSDTIDNYAMKSSVKSTIHSVESKRLVDSFEGAEPITDSDTESSFKVESEHSEKYAYGIATVGTMTLSHVTPTVYLTDEEAAKMPNAFKLGEQSEPRTVLAPDGINTITYSNPNISISTDAMVKANAIYEALAGEEQIEKVDLESVKKPSEPVWVPIENYASSSNSGSSDSSED